MQLFKENYEFMLTSIRSKYLSLLTLFYACLFNFIYCSKNKGKDKNYKIKRVVSTEDNIINEEDSNSNEIGMDFEPTSKSKRSMNSDLILPDTDDEDERMKTDQSKMSKKNAIKEYKEALCGIGSKSTGVTASIPFGGKKVIDKVIVTENEYDANEDWLINDLEVPERKIVNKKFNGTRVASTSAPKSTSNKRKNRNDDLDEDEENQDSGGSRNVEMYDSNSNEAIDDDEMDFQFCRQTKSKATKKRIIDSCPSEDDIMKTYDIYASNIEDSTEKSKQSTKNSSSDKLRGK
jgi:hypothetical protein